jgi:hypothetical protein
MVSVSGNRIRKASEELNVIKSRANLEVRVNFFSVRVVDS